MAVTFVSLVTAQIMSIWVRGDHLGDCRESCCRYSQTTAVHYRFIISWFLFQVNYFRLISVCYECPLFFFFLRLCPNVYKLISRKTSSFRIMVTCATSCFNCIFLEAPWSCCVVAPLVRTYYPWYCSWRCCYCRQSICSQYDT